MDIKSDKPLISIIIPAYKSEKFIPKAIKGLLNQTYSNIEIIVVNDQSPDNLEKVIKSQFDSEIRAKKIVFITNVKNGGASYSRNVGARMANGELLMFADSDELYDPKHVESLYDGLENGNYDYVNEHTRIFIDENDKVIQHRKFSYPGNKEFKLFILGLTSSDILIKRDLFLKLGGFDETWVFGEDWKLLVDAYISGAKLNFVDSGTIFHREYSSSITHKFNWTEYRLNNLDSYIKNQVGLGRWNKKQFAIFTFGTLVGSQISKWPSLLFKTLSLYPLFFFAHPLSLFYPLLSLLRRVQRKFTRS